MNIFDYINENGNRTLYELPFNKVDSLVLCAMSYLKFDKFVPKKIEKLDGISIQDIALSPDYESLFRDERYREHNEKLFNLLVQSRRFGNIRLRDFYDIINTGMVVQFCAMTAIFETGLTYVLFRGTDDNIVGWKEDFNMMFKGPVPAQKMARIYLESEAERIEGEFYVGGHSKGGNLAIYSSSCASPQIQTKIKKIFSHDGPGFFEDFYTNSGYQNISRKIEKQVPRSSVFGLWLFTPDNYDIILSEGEGKEQHNPFMWYIDEDNFSDFLYADRLDKAYELKQEIFNEWVKETDSEKALEAIDVIFKLIDEAGITNMNDLNDREKVILAVKKFFHGYSEVEEETKKKVTEVLNLYLKISAKEKEKVLEQKYEKYITTVKNEAHHAKIEMKQVSSEVRSGIKHAGDGIKDIRRKRKESRT